ncbi:MAG: EamA family transporter [Candidatus Methanoplasma sp.]|jgi:transporter family protein|nr:EamA family transporter [Candidatus Methanoplasma sp.]
MWLVFAIGAAVFAGLTAVLAKIGLKNVDSTLATALRTIVVVIFAFTMVLIVGSQTTIPDISSKTFIFLILSGIATGASWLCYYRALQMGDINKVVPIDKSSGVLTMLLAIIFLSEAFTPIKGVSMVLIAVGTYLMVEKKEPTNTDKKGNKWLMYAILSALFASLTAILGKVGIEGVESNLGTFIRTVVVLIMAWLIVFGQRKHKDIKKIDRRSWSFILYSGLATGLSWLCFYRALQEGPASVVVPIDKLSILVTIAFGCTVFRERLGSKSAIGLIMIVTGTMFLLL